MSLHQIAPYVGQIVGYAKPAPERRSEDASCRRWHALHVRSGWEFDVRDQIEDNGMAGYVPGRAQRVRVNARKHRTAIYPLFPGYLFAGFDPCGDAWHTIADIDGVHRLFMVDFQPVEIPTRVIERVRLVEAGEASGALIDRPAPMSARVGQTVRLLGCGGLTGLFAEVAEVDDDRRFIRIDLVLMRRSVPMWLGEDKFEVI